MPTSIPVGNSDASTRRFFPTHRAKVLPAAMGFVLASLSLGLLTAALAQSDLQSDAQSDSQGDLESVRKVQPEASQSPQDVVQMQLTALGLNQELGDDDGIRIAFRFASPSNKVATGPVEKFIGLVQNPIYRPMLEFESVEFAQSRSQGDEVGVLVKLTMDDGADAGYVFVLSKQDGTPCECWMTDRVVRVDLDAAGGRASPGSSI